MLLTEEKVNLSRQREFDVMKMITILVMITIHVYEELSAADIEAVCTAPFDVILQFLGGPLGATLFMFAMGIGISYSSHRTPEDFLRRGIKLFLFSYLFNFLRSTLPYLITMGIRDFDLDWFLYVTFNIDILNFAGLAFILFALLKKLEVPPLGVCAIAAVMQAVGLLIGSAFEFNSCFAVYFFGIFVKTGDPSCFPLLLWFIYPALGLLYAKYLRHIKDLDRFYLGVFVTSLAVLTVFCSTLYVIGFDIRRLFMLSGGAVYTTTFLHVILSLCCILLVASAVHFIVKRVQLPRVEKVISFMSSNLNNIYIIQWMYVCWLLYFVFFEHPLPVAWVVPLGLLLAVLSCLTVKLCQRVLGRKNIL